MELRQYAQVLWRWLWLIVLGAILAGGTAYFMSQNTPPIYRATTTLYVSQANSSTLTDYTSVYVSQQMAKTYSELLLKRSVYEETLTRLGLPLSPTLDVSIAVQPIRDTQLMELTVDSPDPILAQRIANELPQVFIKQYNALQSGRYAESRAALQVQMDQVQKDIDETQKALDQARTATSLSAEAKQAEVTRLETALTTYRNSYSSLLTAYEQARMADARSLSSIVVAEPAALPEKPVGPHRLRNTFLAALVGMMLGVGTAFLIEYLDDTIKTPADAEQVAGLATLGSINRIRGIRNAQDILVTSKHPRSSVSESYRMMRTVIQLLNDGSESDWLVTSPGPQEGKTATVANLGVAMAQAGHRTIVVDGDLRRPSLHKVFAVQNVRGLATVLLRSDLDVANALVNTGIDGLKLLPSGVVPPNPAELLVSPRMDAVVARLKELADVVIFDCPPALAVADASILATKLKQGIIVVYAGHTRSDELRRTKDALAVTGIALQGVVLNRIAHGHSGYYYRNYYSEDSGDGHHAQAHSRFSPSFLNRRKKAQPEEAPLAAER